MAGCWDHPADPPLCSPRPAQLNKAFQAEESPSVIYCISMQWFREWEAFVKGKDNGEWSTGLALRPPAGRALGLQICGEGPRRRERGCLGWSVAAQQV